MQTLKYFILISVILLGLVFVFGPEMVPENFQRQEILDVAKNSDVIIIFNSGGWGNTPIEKAKDFTPIIDGIQKTLKERGYNSVVIPYNRTKDNLLGKITGVKEFFNFFRNSSEILADDIELLTKILPDKKIIIAGLSAGGALANETIKKISERAENSVSPVRQNLSNGVYAIAAGIPFWVETLESDNILRLDNENKDPLSKGEAKTLLFTLFKAPFKWFSAKILGSGLSFSQALQFSGHQYSWESAEVSSSIESFLEAKLTSSNF